ncbi:MFS transporter [Actinoalloteichus hymeniacidonis]|uniref:Arabinose efflux permease family protein n=1 Tax=Actinoalloteichus hymeniacidonis TaxID=340345 RepID=A0AAC9HUR5_9PSEU|nr:MFS transporter [Actinoalloteichus hymeniacidonis]AOS65823.1 arabinose efflux permease family protein [Actinoalloteichus hymeniacidonis]MBB5906086.1 MFS family permease [Actinoalloteichus hymeniacidonis]
MLRPSTRTEIERHAGRAAEDEAPRRQSTERHQPQRPRKRALYADEYEDRGDRYSRDDRDRDRRARDEDRRRYDEPEDRDRRRRDRYDDRYEDDRYDDRYEDRRYDDERYRSDRRRDEDRYRDEDRRRDRRREDDRYDDDRYDDDRPTRRHGERRYEDRDDDRSEDYDDRRYDEDRPRRPAARRGRRPAEHEDEIDRDFDEDFEDEHPTRSTRRKGSDTRPLPARDHDDDHDDRARDDQQRDSDGHLHEQPTTLHRREHADVHDDHLEHEGGKGPKKLTVTRVAIHRSRQLTGQAFQAFRRAAHADGADKSGLNRLTYAVMMNYAVDAAIAVALANTLFFSAATGESRGRVALYLLITVAPFALIAPIIGPALDRFQRGRRIALAASFFARIGLAAVMAVNFDSWLLYPAALGCMVMSKSFGVLKGAVTPRVLPMEITLVETNARLNIFGLAAGGVFGAIASGLAALTGSSGALWFTAALAATGVVLCLRIPAWVEVTEGEVTASLSSAPRKTRHPMGSAIRTGLWGTGTARTLTGFLTFFAAFVVKAETEESPAVQLMLLGLIVGAAGLGNFVGNAVGARLRLGKPHQVIVISVSMALATTVFAAIMPGILTAALVGLVGSTASALAKISLDSVVQREMPEEARASAFGRTETILQLAWVFGGVLGLLLPPSYWIGFAVLSVLLVFGLVQTVLARNGKSLLPTRGVRPTPPTQGNPVSRPQLGRGRSSGSTTKTSTAVIQVKNDR